MFKQVTLYTNVLKPMQRFYQNVMELDIIDIRDQQFSVIVGETTLIFIQSEQTAVYHFAINIPGNQFTIMKHWIKDRLTLNREGGIDEIYYPTFDADAIYFEDPAGNSVELIGRRKRDLFGSLTKEAFLNISEIGITTPFVTEVGEQLQDFGIPLRHGTAIDPHSLNFLGQDDAFIVLVPPARRWRFSALQSATCPLEIVLDDGKEIILDHEGHIALTKPDTANNEG
ncbi:MAG TPA: hypothetical protein VK044_01325 [Virgibacillus sp.]|nr:hypothetical protein [Virgibacillus sp.]